MPGRRNFALDAALAGDGHGADALRVRESWLFVDADPIERAAFADFDAVLARCSKEPVAPRNRLRVVHLATGEDGRRYFLKRFARTQLGNLLRNRLTAPRCRDDAAREALVAAALRARGFTAPRVVATGVREASSACLLAELPGDELRARIAAGRCDRALADRVARHCGAIARAGVTLPDLSALHVFVEGDDAATARFAVLDLHRGAVRRPGPRDFVRMLRSFARSVHGLGVPRANALRFAVALLRAAGARRATRKVLRRVPPFDTHGRYDAAGRASRYRARDARRDAREIALLARVWPSGPCDAVLDVPCGGGRLAAFARAQDAGWSGTDRSREMLAVARSTADDAPLCRSDAGALPFADASFCGAIVFRFLHHLPARDAARVCAEAARVARRFVVVSFFHPCSVHGLRRRLANRVRGRPATRFCARLGEVDRWFEAHGFVRAAHAADAPYLRELWLARYERVIRGT